MTARAIASGTISFGLVIIPVKFYTAASSETISFRMMGPSGQSIKQKSIDPVTGEEVKISNCEKGYEVEKDKYVTFSSDEIKQLEAKDKGNVSIDSFVPLETVDLVNVSKSYYIKPDKGGDKSFKLLSDTISDKNKVAVGQWTNRGKEHLVLIRSYKGGLILHVLFYKHEVRDYEDNCANLKISDMEKKMASELVDQLSTTFFDSSKYHDKFTERVINAVKQKQAGNEITYVESLDANVLTLLDALSASLKGNY